MRLKIWCSEGTQNGMVGTGHVIFPSLPILKIFSNMILLGCGPSIFFSPKGSVKVKLGSEGRKNGMVDTNHGILSFLPTLEFPSRLPTLFCWDIGPTLMVPKGSLEGRFGMVVGNRTISPSIPTLEISPSTVATILLRNLYLTIYLPLF